MSPYFSDRETGGRPRTEEEINEVVWRGIRSLIESRIADGSFAKNFPAVCPDGPVICGTDERSFFERVDAIVPTVVDPDFKKVGLIRLCQESLPPTLGILDLIEFCFENVARPEPFKYHDYYTHSHLRFDQSAGRERFRSENNEIFGRNGLVYELSEDGRIERPPPAVLREDLYRATFSTGDSDLDDLLETARRKYLDPDESERRIALEKLWDAFERIKTLEDPHKSCGASLILDKAAPASPKLREVLEQDMRELTKLGNELMIRHHETSKEPIAASEHVDHLFGRMFSLVRLLLRMSGRGG